MMLVLLAWFWVGTPQQAWRLPSPTALGVAIVDDAHAVAATSDSLLAIDLQTGAVDPPTKVLASGSLESIVFVGDRLLGFGFLNKTPAAWELELSPASAKPIKIDDAGGGIKDGRASVVVSPDGARILVCSTQRGAVVRDAKTLAAVASAAWEKCSDPHFLDNDHVIINYKVLDLATNAFGDADHDTRDHWAGPDKRVLEHEYDHTTLTHKGAVVRESKKRTSREVFRWSRNGGFVVGAGLQGLTIRPTSRTGAERTIELPIGSVEFDVGQKVAVAVVNDAVFAVTLASGGVRKPEGHLQVIMQVAPRGGEVITVADKLRTWRDGAITRSSNNPARAIAVGGATDPVAVFGYHAYTVWDPEKGTQTTLQPAGIGEFAVARDGTKLHFATGSDLWHATTTTPATAWASLRDNWTVDAIDRNGKRFALHDDKVTVIVDTDAKSVATVCGAATSVRFGPNGTFGVSNPTLFDAKGKPIGEVDLPKLMRLQWDFLPTGEVLVVGTHEIAIFDPTTKTAVGWTTPIDDIPIALGLDPSGTELAVGYNDGSILWANIAELRANATSRPARLVPVAPCKLKAKTFAEIVD